MSNDIIDSLSLEIEANAEQAVDGIDALINSLDKLRSAMSGGIGIRRVVSDFEKFNHVMQKMEDPTHKITALVDGLRPLETLGKNQLGGFIRSLEKIPEVTRAIDAEVIQEFATQIENVVRAIRPLAEEMDKITAGFDKLPKTIRDFVFEVEKVPRVADKNTLSLTAFSSAINALWVNVTMMYFGMKKMGGWMSGWVIESNQFVENLNLFTVSMGKYAQRATRFSYEVQDALGIDPNEFMRNWGITQQILSGFGVSERNAYKMSKNLTQIGYDISSFFNLPLNEAMAKVQSGIAGELEPLRRIGYALDVATLRQIAFAQGIDKTVLSMTQGEKSYLRYLAIMQQSKNVMGDMARTIITPANAMRILNQQLVQLKRALGNAIIPLLIKILPYVQAVVVLLTRTINSLAALLGFELPEIDYSGTQSSLSEITDDLDGATASAKEFKNVLMGFDELNILSAPSAGGKGALDLNYGFDLDVDLPEYDFLGKVTSQVEEIIERFMEIYNRWKGVIETVGTAVLAALSAKNIIDAVASTGKAIDALKDMNLLPLVRVLLGAGGVQVAFVGFKNAVKDVYNVLVNGEGSLAAGLSSLVLGGAGAVVAGVAIGGWIGAVIGGVAALSGALVGLKQVIDETNYKKLISEVFGSIELTKEDAEMLAEKLLAVEWTIPLRIAVEDFRNADFISGAIENMTKDLEKDFFRIQLGFEFHQDEFDEMLDDIKDIVRDSIARISTLELAVHFSLIASMGGEGNDFDLITESNAVISDLMRNRLRDLGEQLGETLTAAYSDGLFKIDEFAKAQEIMEQLSKINQIVQESQVAAAFDILKMKFSGEIFTAESYEMLKTELKKVSDTMMANAEEAVSGTISTLRAQMEFARMEYEKFGTDDMKELYDTAKLAYETYINSNPLELEVKEVQLKVSQFAFDTVITAQTVQDTIRDALDKVEPLYPTLSEEKMASLYAMYNFETSFYKYKGDDQLRNVIGMVAHATASRFEMVGSELGKDIKNFLTESVRDGAVAAEENVRQMQEIIAAGEAVPETIVEALESFYSIDAVVGGTSGLWFETGKRYTKTAGFISALNTVRLSAEELPEMAALGMLSQIDTIQQAGDVMTFKLKDGTEIALGEVNSTLLANLKLMGIDWSEMVKTSGKGMTDTLTWQINQGTPEVVKAVENMGKETETAVKRALSPVKIKEIIANAFRGTDIKLNPTAEISKNGNIVMTISAYALGGHPQTGELFLAREAGVEMVGTMGGRATVATNDDIVEGIRRGVAQGVKDGGGGAGGNAKVYLVMNDAIVGEAVIDYHNSQVRQTGKTPLTI